VLDHVHGEGSFRPRVDGRQQTAGERRPSQCEVHQLAASNAAADAGLPPERDDSLPVQQRAEHDRDNQRKKQSLLDSARCRFAGVRERGAWREQRKGQRPYAMHDEIIQVAIHIATIATADNTATIIATPARK